MLNWMRKKNPNHIIIAHLNINLIRNKFEMLKEVGNKIDILLISETKLGRSSHRRCSVKRPATLLKKRL